MKKVFLFISISFAFYACDNDDSSNLIEQIDGLKPIYSAISDSAHIVAEVPEAITRGSKIYVKDHYVYIVEKGLGVHVIDNTDPTNPSDVRFIRVTGISDVAVRNTTMYANNFDDIVAIDISNLQSVSVLSRLNDAFMLDQTLLNLPSGFSGYFECVDDRKGLVIGWEETVLNRPKCYK